MVTQVLPNEDRRSYTAIERFATTMCPTFVDIIRRHEPIDVLRVAIDGPRKMFGVYINSDYPNWLTHPAASAIAGGTTERGAEWFAGAMASRAVTARKEGDSIVLGAYTGAYPLSNNISAPALSQALVDAAKAKLGFNYTWMVERYAACGIPALPTRDCANYQSADWASLDAWVRGWWTLLGYKPLPDVPSRIVSFDTNTIYWNNNGTQTPFQQWMLRLDDMVRAGVRYAIFPIKPAGSGPSAMILVPLVEDGSTTLPSMEFQDLSTGESLRPGYTANPLFSNTSYHTGFSPAVFLDVPASYRTNVFGVEYNSSMINSLAYSPLVALTASFKNSLRGVNSVTLLPLVAPVGEATYFFRLPEAGVQRQIEEFMIEVVDQDSLKVVSVPVRMITVTGLASDVLSAVPTAWFEGYYASGYGYFKGKGAEAAATKIAQMADLNAYVHTAVYTKEPIVVPRDIVTKLDVYLAYKKAREKACLSNDFMELEFDNGVTWGEANAICNKAGNTKVLYGITDVTPSLGYPVAAPNFTSTQFRIEKTTTPWGVTRFEGGLEVGLVPEAGRFSIFYETRYGATVANGTVAELAANWGYDLTAITVEQNASSADNAALKTMTNPIWRGRGGAAGDFAWENIGISGFPIFKEMQYQDGLKAIIHSLVNIRKRTEPLHDAFLRFGEKAYVGDMFA